MEVSLDVINGLMQKFVLSTSPLLVLAFLVVFTLYLSGIFS